MPPTSLRVGDIVAVIVNNYRHLPDFRVNNVVITHCNMYTPYTWYIGIEIAKAPEYREAITVLKNGYVYAQNVPLYCGINDTINISRKFFTSNNSSFNLVYNINMSWSVSEQRTETTTTPI